MNNVLTVLMLLITTVCSGQEVVCVFNDFEVLGNDTINRTVGSEKEGKWIYYETSVQSIADFTTEKCYHQKKIRHIRSEGVYKNGKKIGQWHFYGERGDEWKSQQYNDFGEKDGLAMEFFEDRKSLKSIHLYEKGSLAQITVFYKNGNIRFQCWLEKSTIEIFNVYYETGELKYEGVRIHNMEIIDLKYVDKSGDALKTRMTRLDDILRSEGLSEYL